MLVFNYKLEKYVKKKLIPKLLINPDKYTIKGSFSRRTPYVTDIDIVTDVYPEINENNIYAELVKLIERTNQDKTIILIFITCGVDERFKINNGSLEDLARIRGLLAGDDGEQFDAIIKKYPDDIDKKIFYINEIIWKYYKLRWKPLEVLNNRKNLGQGLVVKFTDIVKKNIMLLLQYYVKIGMYPIGIDVVVNYKPMDVVGTYYSSVTDYQIKLANYAKDYYYMLFPLRAYFRNNNKKIYQELEELIEKKFGLYKQLMVRIDTYHILYDTKHLDIQTATAIVISIIKDIKYLPDVNTNTITKIKEVAQDNPPNAKMKEWNILLRVLYDDINMAASIAAKEYFFKYLNLLPENLRKKYYLADEVI
jgi:hypothetical protein